MDAQKLFAERIGGQQFGKVQQTFKFTLINNAKQEFKVMSSQLGRGGLPPAETSALTKEAVRSNPVNF